MAEEKKIRYGEHFDVFNHLSNALKDDGKPAFEPYIVNGALQVALSPAGDNRALYVPVYNIDGNAMRDWFYSEFPDGRIETVKLSGDPVFDQGKWVYPPEVFEVRLYKKFSDDKYIANGFGRVTYTEGSKYPEIPSAITIAFKNAMLNAGFGVDIDWEKIKANAPKFFSLEYGEDPAKFVPTEPETIQASEEAVSEMVSEVVKETVTTEKEEEKEPIGEQTSIDMSNPLFAAMAAAGQEEVKGEEEKPEEATKEETAEESRPDREKALDTIFTVNGKPQLERYAGKTFRQNMEEFPEDFKAQIEMICDKRSLYTRWLPEEVLDAAEVLAA